MSDRQYAVSKTYSLTMIHINKVIELATKSGRSQGAIVREAIDLFYSQKHSPSGVGEAIEKPILEPLE